MIVQRAMKTLSYNISSQTTMNRKQLSQMWNVVPWYDSYSLIAIKY